MVRTKLFMTTSAALFAFATAASAASLSGNAENTAFDLRLGDNFTGSANLYGGEDVTYTFNVLENLTIPDFAVSGTDSDRGSDLLNIRFGYGMSGETGVATNSYSQIFEFETTAAAIGSLTGQSFSAGENFFFTFVNNGFSGEADRDLVGTTVSFAAVPVPAAGFLLLGALGAGAFVSRRKKAA